MSSAHVIALITVCVWGTTFISTKVLILSGLSPAQIFMLRFILAYAAILTVSHRRLFAATFRDEAIMAALGITGGSLYFLTENEALCTSPATNVSIIVCSCPLFTMLLCHMVDHTRASRREWLGSLLAFIGMAVVVCNGHFVLRISPRGDLLALAACLCWAVYSLLIRNVSGRYGSLFITRKVFAYGLLTILPVIFCQTDATPISSLFEILARPQVIANLLFLGLIASFACFFAWTVAMRRLGAIRCTNYVYLNPLTTIVFAAWILGEPITVFFLLGAAAIVAGLWLSNK